MRPPSRAQPSQLSREQLISLVAQLEAGPKPLAGTCCIFRLLHLVDGVPRREQAYGPGALSGGHGNVELLSGSFQRLLDDHGIETAVLAV